MQSVEARRNDIAVLRDRATRRLESARKAAGACDWNTAASALDTVAKDTLECALALDDDVRREHEAIARVTIIVTGGVVSESPKGAGDGMVLAGAVAVSGDITMIAQQQLIAATPSVATNSSSIQASRTWRFISAAPRWEPAQSANTPERDRSEPG